MNTMDFRDEPILLAPPVAPLEFSIPWLHDDFASLSDERLVLWYHEIMQDHSSVDSSMRLKLLQEITTRGITVNMILELTAGASARILN